jgi:hypothetical protein
MIVRKSRVVLSSRASDKALIIKNALLGGSLCRTSGYVKMRSIGIRTRVIIIITTTARAVSHLLLVVGLRVVAAAEAAEAA